jgi:ribosomal protein S12 methylthiotransferase accessory factor YcaO
MNVTDVENYFENLNQLCLMLKLNRQNATNWRKRGHIPLVQQYRIAELTEGKLMPDEIDPREVNRQARKESCT